MPPLSKEAVGELAQGSGVDADELHRTTGGNAFYVTEVIAGGESLPASVQDAVIARVARLERRSREVVEAVSIAPRSLGVDQAMHLSGATARQVDAVVGSGVIIGDKANLRFRHDLARSAVEGSIPPARRFALHRKMIALLLEEDPPDSARLAHHAIAAGQPDLIVEYAPIAAELAASSRAHKEAVELLESALGNLERMDGERATELRLDLVHELGIVDRQSEAVEQAAKAVGYYRSKESIKDLGNGLVAWSRALWRNADTAAAEAAQNEAVTLLESLGPSRDLAFALFMSGYQNMLARRAEEATDFVERALHMAHEVGADDLLWEIEMMRGTIEIVLGNVDRAVDMLEKSVQDARHAGDREGVSIALGMLGSGGGRGKGVSRSHPGSGGRNQGGWRTTRTTTWPTTVPGWRGSPSSRVAGMMQCRWPISWIAHP